MALFEVWQNGTCKMRTDSPRCIYPSEQLLLMKRGGCTFRYKGARYTPKRGERAPWEVRE